MTCSKRVCSTNQHCCCNRGNQVTNCSSRRSAAHSEFSPLLKLTSAAIIFAMQFKQWQDMGKSTTAIRRYAMIKNFVTSISLKSKPWFGWCTPHLMCVLMNVTIHWFKAFCFVFKMPWLSKVPCIHTCLMVVV